MLILEMVQQKLKIKLLQFFNKELFSNPLDPERQNFSMIKSLINDPQNQGTATLDVPNGESN